MSSFKFQGSTFHIKFRKLFTLHLYFMSSFSFFFISKFSYTYNVIPHFSRSIVEKMNLFVIYDRLNTFGWISIIQLSEHLAPLPNGKTAQTLYSDSWIHVIIRHKENFILELLFKTAKDEVCVLGTSDLFFFLFPFYAYTLFVFSCKRKRGFTGK